MLTVLDLLKDIMKKLKKDYSIVAVLLFFSLITMLNFDSGEIQGWDEGLYAIRARSILYFHVFCDQTDYAVGGLYSSTYPPMYVWLMSGIMALNGESNLSVRLLSVLSSMFSVFLLYAISTRIVEKENALISALLLTGTFCWNTYARLGMTDIFLIMLFLLAFWSIIKADESRKTNKKYWFVLLFGIAFYCGLMTKIVISLMPLLFMVFYFFYGKDRSVKFFLILVSLMAMFFAYLWYWDMSVRYGAEFYKALLVPHLYSVVENNTPRLGLFYYLNQLVFSNPLLLLSFVSLVIFYLQYKKSELFANYIEKIVLFPSIVWFFAGFVIFSVSVTKLHHYTNYIIPPAIVLTLYAMEKIEDYIVNPRGKWLIIIGLVIWSMWAFAGNLRHSFRQLDLGSNIPVIIIVFLILVIILALMLSIPQKRLAKICNFSSKYLSLLILSLLIIRVLTSNSLLPNGKEQGASETACIIFNFAGDSFVYLYHEHTAAEDISPQLDWYLGGWMCKWDKTKFYQPIALSETAFDEKILRKHYDFPNNIIVYKKASNPELSKQVIEVLRDTRIMLLETKSFAVFSLLNKNRSKEAFI